MKHFKQQLEDNEQSYEVIKGKLATINNMKVYLSYYSGKTKIELIEEAVLNQQSNSLIAQLGLFKNTAKQEQPIFYVYGKNNVTLEAQKAALEREQIAKYPGMVMTEWDKKISLAEFLKSLSENKLQPAEKQRVKPS
jgi:hypothetical protein